MYDVNDQRFDEFVASLLLQNTGRFSTTARAVYTRWQTEKHRTESFLDYLKSQGVLDRITARAILLAWQGRLDARDIRQLAYSNTLGCSLRRLLPETDDRPVPRRRDVIRAVGSKLGRYTIKGILGWGGNGPVYLAVHPTLRGPVAVKVVEEAALEGGEALRESLRLEARLQSSISHSNVVRVIDYEDQDIPFLVLEYVHGVDLRTRLADLPLSTAEAFALIMNAAMGLRSAWRAGIIHSDLKPSNILLTPEGGFKIADFGLARSRRAQWGQVRRGNSVERAVARGSFSYMAPEQFANQADHRSDMYSLGFTAYHALCGSPPIDETSVTAMMLRHQLGDYPPIDQVMSGISPAVANLFQRMSAVDPDRRFADYDELIASTEAAFGMRLHYY